MTDVLRPAPTRWHRPLLGLVALMGVLTVVSAVGLLFDPRLVNGAPVWLKPLKFALSFGLYGAALAWMLRLSTRAPRLCWWAGTVAAVFAVAEVGLITMQAAMGRASHFNITTAWDEIVFAAMGGTIVVVWLATFALGVAVSLRPRVEPAVAWAVRLGLAVSLVGMLLGFLMTAATPEQRRADDAGEVVTANGAHSVGVPDGGAGLPVTGWTTEGGDLRVGHFAGLHALQVLPLVGLGLVAAGRRRPDLLGSEVVRTRLVIVAGAAYGGLVALLTWQALRGQPLLRPDALTLSAAGALLAFTALAAAAVFLARPKEAVSLA